MEFMKVSIKRIELEDVNLKTHIVEGVSCIFTRSSLARAKMKQGSANGIGLTAPLP